VAKFPPAGRKWKLTAPNPQMIDGFVQVCSSSLDLNNSFIEDSVRLLESFFSILMSDFRWGNEAIWLASCKVTKVDTDKTR
jgi:hypothetical protein